jgi:hypothetical protein
LGQELIAIDGSKCKAGNRQERHFGEKQRTRVLHHINEKIHVYRKELDEHDHREAQAKHPTAAALNATIAQCRSRPGPYQPLLETRPVREDLQRSVTDAASRARTTRQGLAVCDHVQMAVDAQHQRLVAHAVTHAGTDHDQRATMAQQAKELRETDHCAVRTAMGYSNGDEVKPCVEEGIVPEISKPQTSANRKVGLLGKEEVIDHPEKDGDRGPAGHE